MARIWASGWRDGCQGCGLYPRSFAGRNKMLLANARSALTRTIKKRKGMDSNQMSGHRRRTNIAAGQHKTNNIVQRIKASIIFIFCS